MSMKFHHIGVACGNIKEEIESIRKIHEVIDVSTILFDEEQHAELCIIKTKEGIDIELISGEQVANILKKRITYYHLCYETDNIKAEISRLQELGALLVSEPKPAILFGNKLVAFLLVSYGLIELVELK
jgi:methylmalonyl-CoA/ethylmalonyl-CoA epimerase